MSGFEKNRNPVCVFLFVFIQSSLQLPGVRSGKNLEGSGFLGVVKTPYVAPLRLKCFLASR